MAYPVAKAGLWPDAVQENVLLTIEGPSSGRRITLSVPLPVAERMALELPGLLAQMRTRKIQQSSKLTHWVIFPSKIYSLAPRTLSLSADSAGAGTNAEDFRNR